MSCLKKRDVLNDSEANTEVLIAEGENFWAAGYVQDALELFAKAGFEEGLKRILARSFDEGDFFIAEATVKALGQEIPAAKWVALGENASAEGKNYFALKAFAKADDMDRVERVRVQLKEDESVR